MKGVAKVIINATNTTTKIGFGTSSATIGDAIVNVLDTVLHIANIRLL